METHRKTLLHLLKERAYKKGNFTLSSGKESEHYINCKPVTLSCEGNALCSLEIKVQILVEVWQKV